MNYIKHLTAFFEIVALDNTLNPSHVSLYMALFQYWNSNRFKNPISISRDEVMRISKVSSKSTYHRCLLHLHARGYITYEPSYNPFKGSIIHLFDFSDNLKPNPRIGKTTVPKNGHVVGLVNDLANGLANGQVLDKLCTSSGTSTGQALVSYINNTNNTNKSNNLNAINLDEQAKNFQNENLFSEKKKKEKKSCAKKKEETLQEEADGNQQIFQEAANSDQKHLEENLPKKKRKKKKKKNKVKSNFSTNSKVQIEKPTIEEIKSYFLQETFPEVEANKFFNYFSSIGWLVGGKSPMVDWKAAAQNWMLNSIRYTPTESPPDRAKHLNVGNDKDYSEPL